MKTNKKPKIIKLSLVKSNNSFVVSSSAKNAVKSINNNRTDEMINSLASLIK